MGSSEVRAYNRLIYELADNVHNMPNSVTKGASLPVRILIYTSRNIWMHLELSRAIWNVLELGY